LAIRSIVFDDHGAMREELLIADTSDWSVRRIWSGHEIGPIAPTECEGFRLTALERKFDANGFLSNAHTIGLRWIPGPEPPIEEWRLPNQGLELQIFSFFPDERVGAWTDHGLRTRIFDLRTGNVLTVIDNNGRNGAGILRAILSHWSVGLIIVAATVAMLVGFRLARLLRARLGATQ
jgi:hypothetical protein